MIKRLIRWLIGCTCKPTSTVPSAPKVQCRPSHGFIAGNRLYCIEPTCPNYNTRIC